MTVKELKNILDAFNDDLEVMTKKTELFGNIAYVNCLQMNLRHRWKVKIKKKSRLEESEVNNG